MTSSKLFLRAFCFFSVLILAASCVHAQYRAGIQGTILDSQGSVIQGATVTLTNRETGVSREGTSDADGVYRFPNLAPGHYSLSVEKTGFKKQVLDDVLVDAEQTQGVNVTLQIGQVTESVTVTGELASLLDTETASGGGLIDDTEIQKLPSFGRDPFQLLQLAPGAFGDGARGAGGNTLNLPGTTIGGTNSSDGIFKTENGGQVTANGARTGENNYTIDGVGMTSVSWGGTAVITPNEDSIKEMRVVTDNYDAEYGRYTGAQVQIISQNGTNQYHGSLYFKAHRPGLDAFQRYNGPGNAVTRDDNRFNDYGGTVGGPILHNKLFAFFSYETIRNNAIGGTAGGWYETQQFRALAPAGSNAAKILAFPGVAPATGTVAEGAGDQHTCADVGLTEGVNCHFIVGQGLNLGSPLTGPLGTPDAGWTSASNPGTGGSGNGSAANLNNTPDIAFIKGINSPSTSSEAQYNGRIDFNATSKDLIAYSMYWVPVTATSINPIGNTAGTRPENVFNHAVTSNAITGLWDHTFSASLLNELRVNAAGWRWNDLNGNPQAPWGLATVVIGQSNNTPSIGEFNPPSTPVSGFGIGPAGVFDQWTYAGKDVLTKIVRSHTLKMGGEVTRLLFVDDAPWNARPNYWFNNLWDFLNDAPQAEQAAFNPLTGRPTDFRKDTRSNIYGFFVQDNYKLRPNLTVTLGLRWEYFGPISEKNGHLASAELGSGANLISGVRVRVGGNLYDAQKTNFGPQLGFAWSPSALLGHDFTSRLVIRGGFGMAYNGLDEAISLNGRSNPPFLNASGILTGSQVVYMNTFPSDVHSLGGYASNPATVATFDPNTNLPVPGTNNFGVVSLTGYPATWPTMYTYHYTLQTEYDFGHQWIASLGYQGSATRHLTQQYNEMVVAGSQGLAFNPVVQGMDWYANDGTANFNALLAELHHRFTNSFELDTQYRFSHSFDTGSNNFANGQYQYNIATNYGSSDFDVRHAFKLWGVWSPTIFHGGHNWMEKIAGGWTISGILNAHSGYPWTPLFFEPDPLFAGSSANGGSGALRPAAYLGGAGTDYSNSTFQTIGANFPKGGPAYFTAPTVVPGPAFACLFPNPPAAQCPKGQQPLGPIPTAPGIERNSFRGPHYFDIDSTISKAFGLPHMPVLGENGKIEFRANFYNLFNKLNLDGTQVENSITNAHFGMPRVALGGRVIEMQARFSF